MEFHKTTQPLKTTGIPAGGFAPIDSSYAPKYSRGHGSTNMDEGHSYSKPIEPVTGVVDTATIARPGQNFPNNDTTGIASDQAHFPPTNLWNGSFNRQKRLESYDIMPVPITGPTTEVVRPVQQANYALPSPRWTAHAAPPVFRYRRDSYGHQYGDASLNGFPMNNGQHMSMAQSYGNNRWITTKKARTMNRNQITPRNVPTPLDDQITNTAQSSVRGTVFTSYRNY